MLSTISSSRTQILLSAIIGLLASAIQADENCNLLWPGCDWVDSSCKCGFKRGCESSTGWQYKGEADCNAYRGKEAPDAVDIILSNLTLKQKVGQLAQIDILEFINDGPDAYGTECKKYFSLCSTEVNETKIREWVHEYGIGSILSSPFTSGKLPSNPYYWWGSGRDTSGWDVHEWRKVLNTVQRAAMEEGPRVPILYGLDSVHGANFVKGAAIFPHQLAGAATYNRTLIYEMGRITAKDTRAAGIPWLFSPILGIATMPKWSRVMETFGEDPYTASEMGKAIILGMQGEGADILGERGAACMKHFIGYSSPRSGHDRVDEWIPERILRQYFVPAFTKAVEIGVATGMESYNELNGVPMVSSREYLTDMLRWEMGFSGMLVTDYQEIINMHVFHKSAASDKEAAKIAMTETTIDMSMIPKDINFVKDLVDLVEAGTVNMSRIDTSVRRVLEIKRRLGLLDPSNSIPPLTSELTATVGQKADRDAALDTVRESITLLENDGGLLPLDPTAPLRILVLGKAANSLAYQSGGWTIHWQGATDDAAFPFGTTILQGIKDMLAKHNNTAATVTYVEGYTGEENANVENFVTQQTQFGLAQAAAAQADLVIACVGEKNYAEKPGDLATLSLPLVQRNFVGYLHAEFPSLPIVLMLVEGRPRLLHGLKELSKAALHVYYPGPEGGTAAAEVLFGEVNPSGRLPITYPKQNGDLFAYWHTPSQLCTQASNEGGMGGTTGFIYQECLAEWPFGHGLSYTSFVYSDLTVSLSPSGTAQFAPEETAQISVTVTNNGSAFGKDAVFLFTSADHRRLSPEVKILKGFTKVALAPGEAQQVQFDLPMSELSYIGFDNYERTYETTGYTASVGADTDCSGTMKVDSLGGITVGAASANPLCQRLYLNADAWLAARVTKPPLTPTPSPAPPMLAESSGIPWVVALGTFVVGIVLTLAVQRVMANQDKITATPEDEEGEAIQLRQQ